MEEFKRLRDADDRKEERNVAADLKRYRTDVSFMISSLQLQAGLEINMKDYMKDILLYQFCVQSPAGFCRCQYSRWVHFNLRDWLAAKYIVGDARKILKPYLRTLHTPNITEPEIGGMIARLHTAMNNAFTRPVAQSMSAALNVIKHMKRAGTLHRILPRMKDSTLFGMKFLHGWLTGSLRECIEGIDEWCNQDSEWVLAFFGVISNKKRVSILTSLPWTHCMLLLQPCNGQCSEYLANYALDILPRRMKECTEVVPSLLSLSLLQAVTQFSTFCGKRTIITVSEYEELGSKIPHDLENAVPLILLLTHFPPQVLRDLPESIFTAIQSTCFGWITARQNADRR